MIFKWIFVSGLLLVCSFEALASNRVKEDGRNFHSVDWSGFRQVDASRVNPWNVHVWVGRAGISQWFGEIVMNPSGALSSSVSKPNPKAVKRESERSAAKPISKPMPKTTVKKDSKGHLNKTARVKKSEHKDTVTDAAGGLYVYVDEQGVPHYALQPLDSRYQLFANSGPAMSKDIKLAVGLPEKRMGRAYYGDTMNGLYVSSLGATTSVATSRRLLGNPNLARYEALIGRHASTHRVDVNLVKAVMAAESGFNSTALSSKNAMGLMQVIPPTAARYGVTADQLMSPERNIYAGVRYLSDLSRMFKGRTDLIVAAYNAGEGAVYKYKYQIPPYAETQNYVRKVLGYYQVFQGSGRSYSTIPVNLRNVRSKTGAVPAKPKKKGVISAEQKSLDGHSRRGMQKINAT